MKISETNKIKFSIIVPVYHGGKFLRGLLQSLHVLDYPANKFEVIVAGEEGDQKSRDIVEAEMSQSKFHIVYINCLQTRKAVKLNAACTKAKGCFLFFVDDDCLLLPDCLTNLEKVIRNENNIGVIGGSDEIDATDSVFELALDCILNSFIGTGGLRKKTGLKIGKYYPRLWNMTVPIDAIVEMGVDKENGRLQVFNESISVYEDVDLVTRVRQIERKIIFAPEVLVKHHRNTNFFSFVIRNIKSTRISKAIGIHILPQAVLGLFSLWLISGAIFSIYSNKIRFMYIIFWILYLTSSFFIGIKGALNKNNLLLVLYVPTLLFSLHFSRGLTYIFLWMSPKGKGSIS